MCVNNVGVQPGVELNGDGGGQHDPGVRPPTALLPGQHSLLFYLYTHFCLVWPDKWSSDIIWGRDETARESITTLCPGQQASLIPICFNVVSCHGRGAECPVELSTNLHRVSH